MKDYSIGMLAMLGTTEILILLAVLAVGLLLLGSVCGLVLWMALRGRRESSPQPVTGPDRQPPTPGRSL